jgi:hypothetical protein
MTEIDKDIRVFFPLIHQSGVEDTNFFISSAVHLFTLIENARALTGEKISSVLGKCSIAISRKRKRLIAQSIFNKCCYPIENQRPS